MTCTFKVPHWSRDVEKKKPHHDLANIKETFSTFERLRITETALTFAKLELRLEDDDLVALVQSVERSHFYKSMTAKNNHRIWQDVYHVPYESRLLYVKFTTDEDGYLLISLKEK